ncbi:peptidoglycan-binding protein, partial [Streptomyces scabiei]|nr:peptidoglycan-binding protein [Streptomyces scabiei]MDW8810432.1 peptidoglycan-binding protein [Streptomyces scabiei]
MSEPTSHICPECSTPRASDGTPSCACGRRASEALLETRTAEVAAAEDFDPLRIRPYVELGDAHGEHDGSHAATGSGPASDRAATIAMPVTTATTGATAATGAAGSDPRGVRTFGRRGEGTPGTGFGAWGTPPSPGPAPLSAARTSPKTPARRPGRRRRAGLVVVLAGTAAAGVMAAAGFASGLFSYDAPERDRALPDDLRASAPDASPDGEASPAGPSGEGGGG